MIEITRIVSALLTGALLAGPAAALSSPDLRASIDAHVAAVAALPQTPAPCAGSDPYLLGVAAANQHAKGNGWMWGGILLPIIGLVALGAGPSQPPPEVLMAIPDDSRPCFTLGYGERSRANKRRNGLFGALAGFVLAGALLSSGEE